MFRALVGAALLGVGLSDFSALYELAGGVAKATVAQLRSNFSSYPANGIAGRYGWVTNTFGSWTAGFFPLYLMQLSSVTSDPAASAEWLELGRNWSVALAPRAHDDGTHDIAFVLFPYLFLWKQHGDAAAKELLLTAATTLSTRYSQIVGCVRSWGPRGGTPDHHFEVIADNLMNLELLW